MTRKEMMTKLKFFFDKKIPVHIDNSDKKYYNGCITEIHQDYIVIDDRKLGEMPITISEIEKLERYYTGGEKDDVFKVPE